MGCAASQEDAPRDRKKKSKKDKKRDKEKSNPDRDADHGTSPAPHTQTSNPLKEADGVTSTRLVGKEKYIADVGAVVMALENGTLIVCAPEEEGLTFAFRDSQGSLFVKDFQSDAQLEAEKNAANLDVPWGAFFKSIASDVMKCKAKVTIGGTSISVTITMTSSKDPKYAKPWTVKLGALGTTSPRDTHRYFIRPMTEMVRRRRSQTGDEAQSKEATFIRVETSTSLAKAGAVVLRHRCRQKRDELIAPRAEGAEIARQAYPKTLEIANLQRKIMRRKGEFRGGALDAMYENGGPRFFLHLEHSPDHWPQEEPVKESITAALREAFASSSEPLQARLTKAPQAPNVKRIIDSHPGDAEAVEGVMRAMQRIDDWDYNVFELDTHTGTKSLVYTTYAILEKMGLIAHFGIDLAVLNNFLSAIQAGYHPNPYHNATHAADVSQINYFIMTKGGLAEKCKLSKEELLAGVLAGSIHDYDHPGFNNNFHTRTNAYLSTLYNDRSVLENHHCACVYEILRLPKYNIFANFTEEQKREVRDTMLEMVLSTDMGNHAKIFGSFRRRQVEHGEGDWSEKDDRRLALSMSIKMADISNCGRPTHLYLQWAKNIANEFYVQGDAEAAVGLSLSPFMDRKKGSVEFPNGQVSFMKFIVIPMFEAISEFLPKMEFCLNHCFANRDYWKRLEDL